MYILFYVIIILLTTNIRGNILVKLQSFYKVKYLVWVHYLFLHARFEGFIYINNYMDLKEINRNGENFGIFS